MKMYDCFNGWARRQPITFYFSPEKGALTMSSNNDFYDIEPMMSCKVSLTSHLLLMFVNKLFTVFTIDKQGRH